MYIMYTKGNTISTPEIQLEDSTAAICSIASCKIKHCMLGQSKQQRPQQGNELIMQSILISSAWLAPARKLTRQ